MLAEFNLTTFAEAFTLSFHDSESSSKQSNAYKTGR